MLLKLPVLVLLGFFAFQNSAWAKPLVAAACVPNENEDQDAAAIEISRITLLLERDRSRLRVTSDKGKRLRIRKRIRANKRKLLALLPLSAACGGPLPTPPPTPPVIRELTPSPSPSSTPTPAGQYVASFSLIDADSDAVIANFDPLSQGAIINIANLQGTNFNIRANTSPSVVGSVRFGFDGNSSYRLENGAPYALAGDNGSGDYYPMIFSIGYHTISATPYSAAGGAGVAGEPLTITFLVVNNIPATPTTAASATATRTATASATATPSRTATNSPTITPTSDPSSSATPSATPTSTRTATSTPTRTATPTRTPTSSATPTFTPTPTAGGDSANGVARIVIDPQHPQWFSYSDGRPFFMCGAGDPEDFFYRNDQAEVIDLLKRSGANTIYPIAVQTDDGGPTHTPFINNNPSLGVDHSKLDQWDAWLTELDDAGVLTFFVLYDDAGVNPFGGGDAVPAAERAFIQALVAKFKHLRHLVWVVKEEYAEGMSAARVSNIAAEIKAADDFNHPVGTHQNHGLVFDFANDANLDFFAIQYNSALPPSPRTSPAQMHSAMLQAWENAAGRYALLMSEAGRHYTDLNAPSPKVPLAEFRQKNWAMAMGGAQSMALGVFAWDDFTNNPDDPLPHLESCGEMSNFFMQTNFNKMSPNDALKAGDTDWVLADTAGKNYILFADAGTSALGLSGIPAGTYDLIWFDPESGAYEYQYNRSVTNGSFARPVSSMQGEAALYIRNRSTAFSCPASSFPSPEWESAVAAEMGLDNSKLVQIEALTNSGSTSVGAIYYHGKKVRAWGNQNQAVEWASASKPVISTMLLKAVGEGRLASVHTPVSSETSCLSGADTQMTYYHLANMISGYSLNPAPGNSFVYNDYAINLYGRSIFFDVYGADPQYVILSQMAALQFQDNPQFWQANPPQYGRLRSVTVDDFARFGLLWANRGNWNCQQLIPPELFENEFFKPQVPQGFSGYNAGSDLCSGTGSCAGDYCGAGSMGGPNDQGGSGLGRYGYNLWINGQLWDEIPSDTIVAAGHGGQKTMIVIPSLGIIAAGFNPDASRWGSPSSDSGNLRAIITLLRDAVL